MTGIGIVVQGERGLLDGGRTERRPPYGLPAA